MVLVWFIFIIKDDNKNYISIFGVYYIILYLLVYLVYGMMRDINMYFCIVKLLILVGVIGLVFKL